jgi:hypothetical protein
MSEHDTEYRDLLAKTMQRDRESILAHWKLGALFAKYGEPVAEIAMAIERSVTYVADHVAIVKVISTREDLDRVLENRDDIQTWTVLVDWVKAGGPGQESDEEPDANEISRQKRQRQGGQPQGGGSVGGLQLIVPAHIIKALADMGLNPREAMNLFWQNVSPNLIMNIAYAGVQGRPASASFASALTPPFQEPVAV